MPTRPLALVTLNTSPTVLLPCDVVHIL